MKQYMVDAFTDKVFHGNPAAVCVMDKWPADALMQSIAIENNLSETAFAVPERDGYRLRWFTPGGEIDFCGHATLGTSFTLFRFYCKDADMLRFYTQVGELTVTRRGELLEMDFPAYTAKPVPVTDEMEAALGVRPIEAFFDRDLLLVLDSEEAVRSLKPDMDKLARLDGLLTAVTARGSKSDSVSRCFAPKLNVLEDPVTGSTHCMIAPLWARRLGKAEIKAYQASKRGGTLYCTMDGNRVRIAGKAVLFAEAEVHIDKLPQYITEN